MIGGTHGLHVRAFLGPVDMRKGFDGLAGLVEGAMGREATDGTAYLFVSRNRIRAKVLLWDGTGLCVYAKRLERGRFPALWSRSEQAGTAVELTASELALFLEGCELVGQRPLSPPPVNPRASFSQGLDIPPPM